MNRIFTTALAFCGLCAPAQAFTITVSNHSAIDRKSEIVEISGPVAESLSGRPFTIKDSDGSAVASQLTHDGKLIFPATVKAGEESVYHLSEGFTAPCDTLLHGRLFPERKDDFAWENDVAAFRAYGPALQRSGERAYGYDVWTKSVSRPVLEERYAGEMNGISYHDDHGTGMDAYNVGPTLGCGATALIDSAGEIVYPYCFRSWRILDRGPLRFTAELVYNPVCFGSDSAVVEKRIISLDRGSYLNKTCVVYGGLTRPARVAAGIVVHEAMPDTYFLNEGKGYMRYTDPTDNIDDDNGLIFTGAVVPGDVRMSYVPLPSKHGDAIGHILAVKDYHPGDEFVYWWGASWSKALMRDAAGWDAYLSEFTYQAEHPLEVIVSK